eukprot:365307-Chlamydomonas_euryale.AAC.9
MARHGAALAASSAAAGSLHGTSGLMRQLARFCRHTAQRSTQAYPSWVPPLVTMTLTHGGTVRGCVYAAAIRDALQQSAWRGDVAVGLSAAAA